METIQGIAQFKSPTATALTIGTFDGVHIGHGQILERLINDAKKAGLQSAVLTFFPHPRMVLQQDSDIKLLNTLEEKKQILATMGLDYLIVHPFTKDFSRLSALEFVRDLLVHGLKAKKIIIGYDHRFGRNRNANITDLISYGNTFDFEVEEIPVQEIDQVSVSSTKIRNALTSGDITTANTYLGYRYMLTGTVTKGKGLGREIGFPTANITIAEHYKLIPQTGVYVVTATYNDRVLHGMMNIGYNPTVDGKSKSIEIHFFDFDENLYGKTLQIQLVKKIRDEHKFDSVALLRQQLEKDKRTSLELLASS